MFDKLIDNGFVVNVGLYDQKNINDQINIIKSAKAIMEEQISNKYFFRNQTVKTLWFDFYNLTRSLSEFLPLRTMGTPTVKAPWYDSIPIWNKTFTPSFVGFTNKMRQEIKKFNLDVRK